MATALIGDALQVTLNCASWVRIFAPHPFGGCVPLSPIQFLETKADLRLDATELEPAAEGLNYHPRAALNRKDLS